MSRLANLKGRGFQSMDPQRVREIASLGGRAAHQIGTAHQFTSEEARQAGIKGARLKAERRAAKSKKSAA